jgi:hypothetical protein
MQVGSSPVEAWTKIKYGPYSCHPLIAMTTSGWRWTKFSFRRIPHTTKNDGKKLNAEVWFGGPSNLQANINHEREMFTLVQYAPILPGLIGPQQVACYLSLLKRVCEKPE